MVKAQAEVDPLERMIGDAAFAFYRFFHDNGLHITRKAFLKRSPQENKILKRKGWIYAFYGDGNIPIYTGETRRTALARFSEHRKNKWWKHWTDVKVLPCEDQSSRKLLESLLGFSGGYQENLSQPSHKEEILYLVLLGLIEIKQILDTDKKPSGNKSKKKKARSKGAKPMADYQGKLPLAIFSCCPHPIFYK